MSYEREVFRPTDVGSVKLKEWLPTVLARDPLYRVKFSELRARWESEQSLRWSKNQFGRALNRAADELDVVVVRLRDGNALEGMKFKTSDAT